MLKFFSKIILTKILGWKLNGLLPNDKKYIIAVVPHSKSFDLVIAILIRSYLGLPISFPETTGCKEPCQGGVIVKNF